MGTIASFSVPVYIDNVTEQEQFEIEVELNQANFDFKSGEEYGLESDALLTDIGSNIFQSDQVVKLKEVFEQHLQKYLEDVQSTVTDVKVVASWLTKTLKGQSIAPHSHRDKDISGVYYVNTNGEDGDLILYSPNPVIDNTKFINSGNMLTIKPKPGQIVFFPSWLLHSTTKNNTDNVRISLAADLVVQ